MLQGVRSYMYVLCFGMGTAYQSNAMDNSQLSRQELITTYAATDSSRPVSDSNRQEASTAIEALNEHLPSATARRDEYLTFDSSLNRFISSDTPCQKLNIDTQHPSVYEELR